MKIKALSNPEGGGYYRIRLPLGELGKHGHDVVCEPRSTTALPDGAQIMVGHMLGSTDYGSAHEQHSWWRR